MQMFAIGSYTGAPADMHKESGPGLSIVSLDGSDVRNQRLALSSFIDLENPAYLSWDPIQRLIFTVCEDGASPGRVDVLYLDKSNRIKHLASCDGNGSGACHISLSHDRTRLFTASYTGGNIAVFNLGKDGSLQLDHSVYYQGSGPNSARQEGSHAHQVSLSHYTNHLYVCDLGADCIWMHSIDLEDSSNNGDSPGVALRLPPGCGPRHLAYDKREPFVYILCELVPMIIVARINQTDGRLEILQEILTKADWKQNTTLSGACCH